MTEDELALVHRRRVARNLRMSFRGLLFSAVIVGIVLSGALPMSASAASMLMGLAGVLAVTRAVRGLWAVRVARQLVRGWGHRRLRQVAPHRALPAPSQSADHRAVMALTADHEEPLVQRAREHALGRVSRGDELQSLLADSELSAVLRRPVAEERARVEADLEALMLALTELRQGEREQRHDLLQRLAARLEVDRALAPQLALGG
jgi:hypothetical protein